MDIDFFHSFKDCIEKLDKLGNDYAVAKSKSWHAQELKYSMVASIIKSLPEMPISKAELEAKNHPDYKTYLEETSKAIEKELKLKAKYESQKARFEAYRSLSSLEKATRNIIG